MLKNALIPVLQYHLHYTNNHHIMSCRSLKDRRLQYWLCNRRITYSHDDKDINTQNHSSYAS